MQEAVGILAGLCQEGLGAPYPDIAADSRQNAAHGNGGIRVRGQKNCGNHGSGRGFAMGTGHGNGFFVIAHQLSQKLRPGKHGDTSLLRCHEFRIVRVNGSRVYNDLAVCGNIGSLLADADLRAKPGQMVG